MPLHHHSMTVSASAPGVREAESELLAFAKSSGLPEEAIWRLEVALDEVLSNVVRHGSAAGGVGPIAVDLDIEDSRVEVVVTDDAPAFNPLEVQAPDASIPLEERPLGGLGIALVKALMDEVTYERRDGRNRLTLRKTLAE
jgi:anti-sigma regulatory factor (Ser/Thr protein kinase)